MGLKEQLMKLGYTESEEEVEVKKEKVKNIDLKKHVEANINEPKYMTFDEWERQLRTETILDEINS